MEVVFENKNLKELYETGKNRKYRLEKQVINSFAECIFAIKKAKSIYDLWSYKSFRFEILTNTNKYSMRLNRKYRLEMLIDWQDIEKTQGIVYILEISNHYGD